MDFRELMFLFCSGFFVLLCYNLLSYIFTSVDKNNGIDPHIDSEMRLQKCNRKNCEICKNEE